MVYWRWGLFCWFAVFTYTANASDSRGGEITFEWLNAYTYKFKIVHYSEAGSGTPNEIEFYYGDGEKDTLVYSHDTVMNLIRRRIFYGTHSYLNDGTYHCCYTSLNWKFGISNQFGNYAYKSTCTIVVNSSFANENSSAQFNSNHTSLSYWAGVVTHNVSAYDLDGDSLVFDLRPIFSDCNLLAAVPGQYQYPNFVGGGSCAVSQSGVLQMAVLTNGIYTINVQISEYRNGQFLSKVFRQILLPSSAVAIEEQVMNKLSYFPNPCSNQLTVNLSSEPGTIDILDLSGRVVQHFFLSTGLNYLDVSFLENGIYFIRNKDNFYGIERLVKY